MDCPFAEVRASRRPICRRGEIPLQRLSLERARCTPRGPAPTIRRSDDVVELVRGELADRPQEAFLVLHLNSANQAVAIVEVALGSIASVQVDPRLVLGSALAAGVPKLVAVHNHPSGSIEPSVEDEVMTSRLASAARSVGLTLLDHIIVAPHGSHFSFADAGRLP